MFPAIPDLEISKATKEKVSDEEWKIRVDLAAAYRLVAMHGWDDLVFTHISARVPGDEEHFLINPYGLFFNEITAGSLVKVDINGNKVLDTPYEINPPGFVIHSAIHEHRHDVGCVIHTHTRAGIAVSAQKNGLLPISQQSSFLIPQLGYHDYEGVVLTDGERGRLVENMGTHNLMILRNHGLLACGPDVANAFLAIYLLESACQAQVMAQSAGELTLISDDILENTKAMAMAATKGMMGMVAWPGLLRKLDRVDESYKS